MSREVITGATAVGLIFKDGVILAAEKRMTYGRFITAKGVKKVFKITDKVGAACAGWMADMQEIMRRVKHIVKLKEMEENRPLSVNSIAKLTSVLLFQNRLYPLMTQVIVGGYVRGPQVYSLDPLGSIVRDKFVATGSGGEIAMGVLEAGYREELSKEEAKNLALNSIKAAIRRDAISGDGIDSLIIDINGAEEESIIF